MNKLIAAFSAFGLLACSAVPVGVTPAPIGNSAVKYSKSVQLAKPDHMTADLIRSHIRQNGAYSDRKDFIEYWIRYDHSSSSQDLYTIGFDLIRTESMFFAGSRYSVLINGYDGDRLTVDPSVTLSSNIGQNNIYYYLDISSDIPIDSKIGTMVMTEYSIPLDSGGEPANPNLDIFGLLSFQFNSLFYYDDETDPMIQIEELSTGEDLPTPDGTATGYSSVYSDLLSLEVSNLDFYRSGLSPDSELLNLSEAEDGLVYLYVYRINSNLNYDRADISLAGSSVEESFKPYKLLEVSYEDYLVKYLVEGLTVSSKPMRRYAVRQIYNIETQQTLGDTIAAALEFQVARDDYGNLKMQTNKLDSVVLDGISAFSLIPSGYSVGSVDIRRFIYNQRYYRAFNLTVPVEDILRVDVEFTSKRYSGLTDIGFDLTDQNGDKLIRDLKGSSNFKDGTVIEDLGTQTVSIEPATVNYRVTKPWFFHKVEYSYNSIQRIDKDNTTEALKPYTWIITYSDTPLTGYMDGSPFNLYWRVNGFLDVTSATVLTLKAMTYGEIVDYVAIDARHQSSGNVPTDPDKLKSFWQRIVEAWSDVLNGEADIGDWFVFGVSIIVGFLILGLVVFIARFLITFFKR